MIKQTNKLLIDVVSDITPVKRTQIKISWITFVESTLILNTIDSIEIIYNS